MPPGARYRAVRPDARVEVLSRDTMPDLSSLSSRKSSRFRADAVEDQVHEQNFRRWAYRREGAFDRGRLAAAIEELPPELLRLKGACRVAGDARAVGAADGLQGLVFVAGRAR